MGPFPRVQQTTAPSEPSPALDLPPEPTESVRIITERIAKLKAEIADLSWIRVHLRYWSDLAGETVPLASVESPSHG